jgi:hypothetical protein
MARFIVALIVGLSAALTAGGVRRAQAADGKFAWVTTPDSQSVLQYDGKPAAIYMFAPLDESTPARREATFKPYHHLYSLDGETRLTNGAGAALYPHHHGVFFGFKDVTYHGDQTCDVWHCLEKAYQSHEGILETEVDDSSARQSVAIDWHGRAGETFAHERREVRLERPQRHDVEGWLFDFRSHVETADGQPFRVDGDPQHAGFHFRAAPETLENLEPQENAAKQIYYLRPDGKGAIGETRNWDKEHPDAPDNAKSVDRPWDAMSFVLHDRRYTVLYLDHPDNPKPSRSSERAYGRFGSYFVADVTPEKPLDVKYRLWIQDGEMTVDECQALSEEFVGGK